MANFNIELVTRHLYKKTEKENVYVYTHLLQSNTKVESIFK